MSMLPEIRMVDRLDGKEFKLGEYEHDEETGRLYVGTHGTVFPGGSGTTGGGGGGSGGGGTGGWFPSGFESGTEIKYEFRFQQTVRSNLDLSIEFKPASNYGLFPIEVYQLSSVDNVFQPKASASYGFFFE